VLALREHYLEKPSEKEGYHSMGTIKASSPPDPDAWAMKFIDVMWVQPILEAFDDDASGFISVTEVNAFTSSRPDDWRFVSCHSKLIPSDGLQLAALVGLLGCR
jgi:hypothetical protein